MTEKRFEVYDDGFSKHIEDTYYTEDKHEHNLYDIWEMCRKLNELYKENMQLKSENQRVSEQKHIYKQDWKHLCIDKELLDSENEKLKSRVDDLKELNKIYVDFIVNEGYELADVMGKCDVE